MAHTSESFDYSSLRRFLKVSDNRPAPTEAGAEHDATWRQAIYEKVLQPTDVQCEAGDLTPANLLGLPSPRPGKRSKEELRLLWKMAIDQTVLLVRMERENAKLKKSEETSAVRRIKLEYVELGACDTGVASMWDSLLASRDRSQPVAKVDRHMLTQAVIQGVPRMSRGLVWYFLAEQACLRSPPPDPKQYPRYQTPYKTLLAGLTKHQHAILIDLGHVLQNFVK
ncbi:TBC1 domain family member 1-like [Cydia splendana]|uniref:TBC1 domain family member 1-like n=1 Tax=Cydia splendana TaxID=1100963 RepID=UPI00300CB50D